MVARARRLWTPTIYLEALPREQRMPLMGFLSAIMPMTRYESNLTGEHLVLDATQAEMADVCGIDVRTVRRWISVLADVAIFARFQPLRGRKRWEIVEPGTAAEAVSDHRTRETTEDTGVRFNRTQVSGSADPVLISIERSERSRSTRFARSTFPQGGKGAAPDTQEALARSIVAGVAGDLRRACPTGAHPGAWAFGRSQGSTLEEIVRKRLDAHTSNGAGSRAVELTGADVGRVLEYSLEADKPAAHFYKALTRDWNSGSAPDSEASRVREAGKAAESPVSDLGKRDGFRVGPGPLATPQQQQRLQELVQELGGSQEYRAAARRIQTAAEAQAAIAALSAALIQQSAEVN